MGRFIDCHIAVAPWGEKAKFRRAKVGLLRRVSSICIAVFYSPASNEKFPIEQKSIELLPAAIRLRNLQKDLFIREPSDEKHYSIMMREIKVLLNKDKLRQSGKAEALDRLISSIAQFDSCNPKELVPSRLRARLVGNSSVPINGGTRDDAIKIATNGGHIPPFSTDERNICDAISCQKLDNRYLKSISISGLDRLPKQLWFRASLNELTLTNCNLKFFPKQLVIFSKTLLALDLSNNRIETVPRTFCCKMNNLELLNLSNNLIQTLPIEIKFFSSLEKLNISRNRLRMLPSTFSDLKSLRNLDVSNNELSQLPAFRKEDIRLEELDVSYNPLDGASDESSTFEVYPSHDCALGYHENPLSPLARQISKKSRFPSLFAISLLRIVRCDRLLKLASEESLPETIVSTMQKEIFKCFNCGRLNMLPAYNSTDILDYLEQVDTLTTTGNYRYGMTFMKLLCRQCFDNMTFS